MKKKFRLCVLSISLYMNSLRHKLFLCKREKPLIFFFFSSNITLISIYFKHIIDRGASKKNKSQSENICKEIMQELQRKELLYRELCSRKLKNAVMIQRLSKHKRTFLICNQHIQDDPVSCQISSSTL